MAFFQSQHVWIKHLADGVATLVLDRQDSPTNFLDPAMLEDVSRAIDAMLQSGQYRLLIIRSGKTANYCHGISYRQLLTWTEKDFASWADAGQKICGKLTDLSIPSVAVIAGSCLDAGLELALACDYRVVVDRPSTSLGFPQLEWGMIPCWGGTQRLPHLIGLNNSMHMLLEGERQNARQAMRSGLADELVEDVDADPPSFLADPHKRDWAAFPGNTWREVYLESNRPGRWFLFRGAKRILRRRIPAELPAPAEILEALRQAYQNSSIQAGADFERQALERIVQHPALHHLLRLLQQREKLRPTADTPSGKNRIRHIGINGAGVLGLSLLLHGVNKGYEIVLRTQDDVALGAALTQIVHLLQDEVNRGTMSQMQYQKSLSAIRGTYTWTHFDKLDLVVDTDEQASLGDRLAFFQELEKHISASALLVSTSLTHRVADLRPALQHPERLLGLHIIEPWKSGSLAEIVVPEPVSEAAVLQLLDWTVSLGKSGLELPDRLGGLAMRIWLPALNEAGLLIQEGIAIDQIDAAMRHFGMAHGPLEWMDRIGVDQIAGIMSACQTLFVERLAFSAGFFGMVDKQWLGNRTRLGFYHHGGRLKPNHEAAILWRKLDAADMAPSSTERSQADARDWIQKRLVTLTILEAVHCLEEGWMKDADELDCAMCLTGWASHRGGPIGHARQLGFEAIAAACSELTPQLGRRFAPIASLRQILGTPSISA